MNTAASSNSLLLFEPGHELYSLMRNLGGVRLAQLAIKKKIQVRLGRFEQPWKYLGPSHVRLRCAKMSLGMVGLGRMDFELKSHLYLDAFSENVCQHLLS